MTPIRPATIPTNNSYKDVTLAFFKEKWKELAKIFGYSAGWGMIANPNLPPEAKHVNGLARDIKNFGALAELPKKVDVLTNAASKFVSSPSRFTARTLIKETSSFAHSACDSIDLSNKFFHFTDATMHWVKGIGFASTLIGCGNNVIQELQDINKISEPNADKTTLHMLNTARDTSYVGLALIGLYCTLTATAFYGTVMLSCLTSALVFTIGGFFYERIVDPYQKHQNPEAVVQNLRNENAYLQQHLIANRISV